MRKVFLSISVADGGCVLLEDILDGEVLLLLEPGAEMNVYKESDSKYILIKYKLNRIFNISVSDTLYLLRYASNLLKYRPFYQFGI